MDDPETNRVRSVSVPSGRRRWTGRTRMLLTLQLAVVLPAALLIALSVWNLRHIQRDRAVEAAIQRDLSEILRITEKRLGKKAHHLMDEVRTKFPCPSDPIPQKLDELLEQHPQFAHAFLWEPEVGVVFRSQRGRLSDPGFRAESEQVATNLRWLKIEGKAFAEKLRKMHKEGMPYHFFSDLVHRGDKVTYLCFATMTLPNWPGRDVVAGGIFDADYLKDKLFPAVLEGVLAEEQGGKNGNPAVMMLRWKSKESTPLVASKGWDGGKPEVEYNFDTGVSVFPITSAIKYRGTTIEAMSQKFLKTNFLIIGGISVFLMIGIWQTYRNVSREMALAKLKSDFVANVSHELRTPLSLIRLYAETLEMGRLTSPDKPQEYYRIMRKESERLTALISNILDFSRIEAGRKEYDFRETNLAELVRNTLEAYRYQIEQNGFAFRANIAEDIPPVRIDREAIARSLLNLINNAVKYSSKEKFLNVNLYRSNGDIKLEVIDHGIGIPGSEHNKIFEKFYRVGDPLVHNTKGSGLGLSLVQHIVQAHGGQISVESAPGKGSKFTIALPLASGGQSAQAN